MQVFNGIVRLEGNPLNEVYKRGLTVPEILILNKIHDPQSGAAVVKLEHAGSIEDFDDEEERERLSYQYDQGLDALHEDYKTSVKKMFSEYGPLPATLKSYTGPLSEKIDELEEFQKSEPFASPNSLSVAEERKQRKEDRKKTRDVAQAQSAKISVQKNEIAHKSGKKSIETVL